MTEPQFWKSPVLRALLIVGAGGQTTSEDTSSSYTVFITSTHLTVMKLLSCPGHRVPVTTKDF